MQTLGVRDSLGSGYPSETLHPNKGLKVDQDARMQIVQVLSHDPRETQQFRVGVPARPGPVFQKPQRFRGLLRHGRLEKMSGRFGDEPNTVPTGSLEPGLRTRKPRDYLAPGSDSLLRLSRTSGHGLLAIEG